MSDCPDCGSEGRAASRMYFAGTIVALLPLAPMWAFLQGSVGTVWLWALSALPVVLSVYLLVAGGGAAIRKTQTCPQCGTRWTDA